MREVHKSARYKRDELLVGAARNGRFPSCAALRNRVDCFHLTGTGGPCPVETVGARAKLYDTWRF